MCNRLVLQSQRVYADKYNWLQINIADAHYGLEVLDELAAAALGAGGAGWHAVLADVRALIGACVAHSRLHRVHVASVYRDLPLIDMRQLMMLRAPATVANGDKCYYDVEETLEEHRGDDEQPPPWVDCVTFTNAPSRRWHLRACDALGQQRYYDVVCGQGTLTIDQRFCGLRLPDCATPHSIPRHRVCAAVAQK